MFHVTHVFPIKTNKKLNILNIYDIVVFTIIYIHEKKVWRRGILVTLNNFPCIQTKCNADTTKRIFSKVYQRVCIIC